MTEDASGRCVRETCFHRIEEPLLLGNLGQSHFHLCTLRQVARFVDYDPAVADVSTNGDHALSLARVGRPSERRYGLVRRCRIW